MFDSMDVDVLLDLEGEAPEEPVPQGFVYPGPDGELLVLSEADQEWVVQKIVEKFERLDSQKSAIKRRWQRTEKAIKGIVSEIEKDRFYALVPFGKQSVQTLISHFWGRSLQTPKIFFSVEGQDEESKEMAPTHRANLLRHLEKDRVRQKMDKALHLHGLPKGVAIFHIGYCNKTQKLHGQSGLVDKWETGEFGEVVPQHPLLGGPQFRDIEKKVLEGASLTVVDPYDFVFDTDNHENWDACFKGYKSWWVYEDIAAEPHFSNHEELKEQAKERTDATKKTRTNKKNRQKSQNGVDEHGRIEVIEVHGDFRLPDGTYLRNWTFVVGGRKKLIRFESNQYYINPFHKWCYEETEDGWGLSPIDYILGFIDASSILLSTGVEAAKMAINPPLLAEESHFPQKKLYMTDGMIVKYKANAALPNVPPQPIQFNYQAPFPYVQMFESQSEATTGATRQLSGNVTTNDKVQTATEFQGLQVVGNLIIDRVVDLFNLDGKLPIIEKMALINAMFSPEERTVPIENDDGVREFKQVEAKVYYGNYDYEITDNKSEMERKQHTQEKISFFQMGVADPVIGQRMKRVELYKEVWRDMGYGQPGLYFMDDAELVDHQLREVAIQQEVQLLAQQRLQTRMMQEGALPYGPPIPGQGPDPGLEAVPGAVAPPQGAPGGSGLESLQ